MISAARFTGWRQVSLCTPSADALGYNLSPAVAGFQSITAQQE